MSRLARLGGLLTAAAVLAGCGTGAPSAQPSAPPISAHAPSAPVAPSAPDAPGATGGTDAAVCAELAATTPPSALRQVAEAADRMPILPAAAAIILLGPRQVASTGGAQDPELAAAQAELVAAIDDFDAQARALLGPEGNAAQDAVQLDADRLLAAIEEIERVCAS